MATKKTKGKALSDPETMMKAGGGKKKAPVVTPASDPLTLFASGGGKKKKQPVKVREMLLFNDPLTLFAAVSGNLCLEQDEVTKVKLKLTKKKGKIVINVVD